MSHREHGEGGDSRHGRHALSQERYSSTSRSDTWHKDASCSSRYAPVSHPSESVSLEGPVDSQTSHPPRFSRRRSPSPRSSSGDSETAAPPRFERYPAVRSPRNLSSISCGDSKRHKNSHDSHHHYPHHHHHHHHHQSSRRNGGPVWDRHKVDAPPSRLDKPSSLRSSRDYVCTNNPADGHRSVWKSSCSTAETRRWDLRKEAQREKPPHCVLSPLASPNVSFTQSCQEGFENGTSADSHFSGLAKEDCLDRRSSSSYEITVPFNSVTTGALQSDCQLSDNPVSSVDAPESTFSNKPTAHALASNSVSVMPHKVAENNRENADTLATKNEGEEEEEEQDIEHPSFTVLPLDTPLFRREVVRRLQLTLWTKNSQVQRLEALLVQKEQFIDALLLCLAMSVHGETSLWGKARQRFSPPSSPETLAAPPRESEREESGNGPYLDCSLRSSLLHSLVDIPPVPDQHPDFQALRSWGTKAMESLEEKTPWSIRSALVGRARTPENSAVPPTFSLVERLYKDSCATKLKETQEELAKLSVIADQCRKQVALHVSRDPEFDVVLQQLDSSYVTLSHMKDTDPEKPSDSGLRAPPIEVLMSQMVQVLHYVRRLQLSKKKLETKLDGMLKTNAELRRSILVQSLRFSSQNVAPAQPPHAPTACTVENGDTVSNSETSCTACPKYEAELALMREEMEQLVARIQRTEQLEAELPSVALLQKRYSDAAMQCQRLEAEHDIALVDQGRLRKEVDQLTARVEHLKAFTERLEHQRNALLAKILVLLQDRARLQPSTESLIGQPSDTGPVTSASERTLKTLTRQRDQLTAQLDELGEAIEEHLLEISNLENINKEKTEEARVDSVKRCGGRFRKSPRRSIQIKASSGGSKQEELLEQNRKEELLTIRLESQKQKIESLGHQVESLLHENTVCRDETKRLVEEKAALVAESISLKTLSRNAKTTLEIKTLEIGDLKHRLTQEEEASTKLQLLLTQFVKDLEHLSDVEKVETSSLWKVVDAVTQSCGERIANLPKLQPSSKNDPENEAVLENANRSVQGPRSSPKAIRLNSGVSFSKTSSSPTYSMASESETTRQTLQLELDALRCKFLCTLCNEGWKDSYIRHCGHSFCHECLKKTLLSRNRKCPQCNQKYQTGDIQKIFFT